MQSSLPCPCQMRHLNKSRDRGNRNRHNSTEWLTDQLSSNYTDSELEQRPCLQETEISWDESTFAVKQQHQFLREHLGGAAARDGRHYEVVGRQLKVQVKREQ